MISTLEKHKQSALERIQGEDLPPRLPGYYPYQPLSLTVNICQLVKELEARDENTYDPKSGVKKGVAILKVTEKKRLENDVEKKLLARGKTFATLSVQEKITHLKTSMQELEETYCGEFDVDINKYFKMVGDLDEGLFEVE